MKLALHLLFGLLGGIVATGPMTIAMIRLHRRLPRYERHPLPPREITSKAIRAVGLGQNLNEEKKAGLTLLNHFAYGGAAGAAYILAASRLPGSPVVKGPLYGLLVWSVSYLDLLPALHILKPADRHFPERNALMIFVHLIWGLFLSIFVEELLKENRRNDAALAGNSILPHLDKS